MGILGCSRATATVLAAALIATPAVALAQPTPAPAPPTSAQKQKAGDLVNRAIAKGQAGDQQGAIDLYLQAYAILPEPVLLSNVGAAYQQANKPVEALKYFCKYLDVDPTGTNASYALAQAKQLQGSIGNNVDDNAPCAKPKPVEHPVVVTPPPVDTAPSGMSSSGPVAADDDAGRTTRLAGLGVAGLGVIGLALGIYYGVQARNLSNEITNHPMGDPWPDNIQSIQSDGKSDQSKQIGFLVAGGVLAIGGAVIYVVGRSQRSSSEGVAIAPMATGSTFGLVVGGGF